MSKFSLLSATILTLGVGTPFAASAQTAPDPIPAAETAPPVERVVVSAQTREQDLIEVPINITVADQAKLDLLGTDDIEEFANFVPGLQVQAQSLNTSSYSLRGVTSDGGRPRVAIFQNGVSISSPGFGNNMAMFDLERIEVVKGPQATLFGQGALVGGINFLQNRASLSGNEGWASLDGGDYGYIRAEAGYNFAISDTLAVRIAALVKNRDGYVPNVSNSPDLMGQDTTAIRGAIAWRPSNTFRADLWLNYETDDSTGTQFKSGVIPPPGGDLSPYSPTANNITPDQLRDKLGDDRDIYSETLKMVWNLSDAWSLTSLSAHRYIDNLEAFDSDGTDISLLQFATIDKGQVWSQEIRANYDNGGPVSAFFGANYYTQSAPNRLRFSTDEAAAQALLAPQIAAGAGLTVAQIQALLGQAGVPGAANFGNLTNPLQYSALLALTQGQLVPLSHNHVEENYAHGEQTNYDIFGDVSWKATDRLTLTGGLRVTWDELYSDNMSYLVRGNPALGGMHNAVTGGTTLVATDSNGVPDRMSYDGDPELTWRLNAAYRINADLNTWVAIGRGRRPPSLSSNAASPTGYEVVSQEIYDNIEAGLAGVFFNNRLRTTTSVYYGEYKDFQTTRYDVSQGSFITENSGNATTYGFEFEGDYRASDFLDLYGTYAYTFAEYDDTDSDGNPLQYAGHKFRLSPENSFSLAARVHVPVDAINGEVYFVPSYTWKDAQFFEDDNDANEHQDAYGLLDLKLGYDSADKGWGASVYVTNALDEEYLIDAGNTGATFGLPTYIRGLPKMVGAGLYVKF